MHATGISWSPLSGLKGVKHPVKFGEKTRDSSQGQAKPGDEFTIREKGRVGNQGGLWDFVALGGWQCFFWGKGSQVGVQSKAVTPGVPLTRSPEQAPE